MSIDALLIYPKLGSMDSMVKDIPLSILYAASDSVKRGYDVRAVDLRCMSGNWKSGLDAYLSQRVILAGISVMTGTPLANAREISRYIRANYPETQIVWGGPHVTLLPETINETFIDFLVRGYGSRCLAELMGKLKNNDTDFSQIKNLSFKNTSGTHHNPRAAEHEMLHFTDIPYHLINVMSSSYTRSYMKSPIFPIFTSIGCPYNCSFCVHPTIYRELNPPRWRPHPVDEVIGHMQYVIEKFGVNHICFIDDTSFPDLDRMRLIFELIIKAGMRVSLEFRGARVNEIDRMDDDFLSLMVKAGGRVMMVGVESASNRVLQIMQKGITQEQILRVNKKLARYPQLTPHYNFLYGTPGETYKDLLETKEIVLQLLLENPNAYFGFGSDWKPIPGSKLLDIARSEYGFSEPKSIDDWIEMDSSDSKKKIRHSWYTRKHNNMIKLMQLSSFVIDDKIIKESAQNKSAGFRFLRLASRLYKPIAKFRLKHNIHHLLIEFMLWKIAVKLIRYLVPTSRDECSQHD